jgi:hypothetical protein
LSSLWGVRVSIGTVYLERRERERERVREREREREREMGGRDTDSASWSDVAGEKRKVQ